MLFAENISGQMIYDTLLLNELEIIAIKDDYSRTVKKTTIDTLIKSDLSNLDLGELLAAYTPVYIKSYGRGSLATASFRGTGASHTQVLWNGFQMNSPMLGQVDFSQIPNSFFDEIELLYGGGSLKISSGALGGSVSLSNSTAIPGGSALSIEQAFGSFKSITTNAGFLLSNSKFESDTRFSLQSSENNFEYLNTGLIPNEEMIQSNAAFRNVGFTQQFKYRISELHQISFITWNQWNERDIPPIMPNVNKGGDPEENQDGFFSRNILKWNFSKNSHKLILKAAYFNETQNYFLKTTTNADSADVVTLIDSENTSQSFELKLKYGIDLKKGFQFSAGIDMGIQGVNSNNYNGNKDRKAYEFYADILKDIRGRLKLNLLVRTEIADGELLPLMPLFGVNYKLLKNDDFYLRTSISRNYHLPTLNDLYWYPGGNEMLEAEEGIEAEIGLSLVKKLSKRLSIKLSADAYASTIDNWIQWVPSDFRYWSPENIAEVYARGAELSAHLTGTMQQVSFKVFAEYAYTKTTNESEQAQADGSSGEQLIYIPLHTANGFVYGAYGNYDISWSINFIGERQTVKKPLPAYVLNNVSVGKRWFKSWFNAELRFKINNLFNVSYQTVQWRAMPGRNFELNMKIKLKKT